MIQTGTEPSIEGLSHARIPAIGRLQQEDHKFEAT
jgi:hypothetical protein